MIASFVSMKNYVNEYWPEKNGKKKFAKTKTNLIKLKVRSLIAKDRVYHLAKLLAYTSRRKWLIDANSIKTPSCFRHTESQASAKMIQILPVNKITIRRFIHELPKYKYFAHLCRSRCVRFILEMKQTDDLDSWILNQ